MPPRPATSVRKAIAAYMLRLWQGWDVRPHVPDKLHDLLFRVLELQEKGIVPSVEHFDDLLHE